MSVWSLNDLGELSQKICWVLFGSTAITVGLRIYCRVQYSPRYGGGLFLDDLATVGCLLVLLIFCILLSAATVAGVGKHYTALSATARIDALKWNAILAAATPWTCTLPKFAIIMTLNRILTYGKRTTIMLWGLAISCQLFVVILSVWGFTQCTPVVYQWDKSAAAGSGYCASPNIYLALSWATYTYSTILDVFFALFPVPFVMRLNIPLKTRIGVSISLSISLIGFAISIYKFTILDKVSQYHTTDPSFPMVYLAMTHAAEGSFLIMSTSLATLRPLYRGLKRHVTVRTVSNGTPLSDQSGSGFGRGTRGLTQTGGGGGGGSGRPHRWTVRASASRAPPSGVGYINYDEGDLEGQVAVAVPAAVIAATTTTTNDEDQLLQQQVPTSKFSTKNEKSSKECLVDITISEEAAEKGVLSK